MFSDACRASGESLLVFVWVQSQCLAVFTFCWQMPGHRLVAQPFLLFHRTMNNGSKNKASKARAGRESIKRKRLFISTA